MGRGEDKPLNPSREYVLGDRLGNAAEAYRRAYDAADQNKATLNASACRLLKRPHVRAEVERLQDEAAETLGLTLDQHLAEFERLKHVAEEKGDLKTAARCEELRGRACGFHVERHMHHHQHQRLSEEQAMKQIVQPLREDPSLLDELRRQAPDLLPQLREEAPDVVDVEYTERTEGAADPGPEHSDSE